MAVETSEDLAAMFDQEDFAVAVTYEPLTGAQATFSGIWEAAHATAAAGEWQGISTAPPVLTTAAAFLPSAARTGDSLTAEAVAYRVSDIQPDGTGLVRLILERK